MATGVVIGKFMPPHLGHLHLIEQARRQVDELVVLVCSLPDEPIPGEVRFAWMTELRPDARVVHVTDQNPTEPHEHEDFWDIWVETIRRRVTAPDIVFTSEDYGAELARRVGARHVSIDRERRAFPVSGTAIRNDPFAHWKFIPEAVRPWFAGRVVLTGSECVGKTTLARELALHFDTVWVSEFGREYVDRKGVFPDASDVEPIARGQIAKEDSFARAANRIMILDTDLISTCVYAEHYYGVCQDWIREASIDRATGLYLLLDIDVPWTPDPPNRDRGHMREEMQELFRAALEERDITWVDIRGSWEERREAAIAAIEARWPQVAGHSDVRP
jgi:NadR type nicotinamide-nucleotide adenylyltransferase